MKRAILALLIFSVAASAQNILDVMGIAQAALSTAVTLQTETGPDGTVCGLYKFARAKGAGVYAWFSCVSADKTITLRTAQIQSASASVTPTTFLLGQGSAAFLVALNPTAAPIAFGSLGTAPANGIAWQSTPGDGVTVHTGSVSWP